MKTSGFHLVLSVITIVLTTVIFGACSSKFNNTVVRGSDYELNPGAPELRMLAQGFFYDDGTSYIKVNGDIVFGSLIFANNDGLLSAELLIEAELIQIDAGNSIFKTATFDTVVSGNDRNLPFSQDIFSFEKNYDAPPGTYRVNLVATDKRSGKKTERSALTKIPDSEESYLGITGIELFQKDPETDNFQAITTYSVPSSGDSLRFGFQTVKNTSDDNLELNARLIKFKADSLPARSTTDVNYHYSSLSYRGIDYNEGQMIQESMRNISQTGSIYFEYNFDGLPFGNYRFEANLRPDEAENDQIYKARDFAVRSESYPSVSSPEELAAPLFYLMEADDHRSLMEIQDKEILKNEVDRFWLSNLNSRNLAKDVLSLYYERVEEANKLFSNFKEGWKTDRGMIYILFGPPLVIEKRLDEIVWFYTYNKAEIEKKFTFDQVKKRSGDFPFDHYILEREYYYFNEEYNKRQGWLNGTVITNNL